MYRILFELLIIFLLIVKRSHSQKSYQRHTLMRVIPNNEEHLEFCKNLGNTYSVNFWRPPGKVEKPVDFVIQPSEKEKFLEEATQLGLNFTTLIDDVQSAFEKQSVRTYERRNPDSFSWRNYYRIDDMNRWLKDLAVFYPEKVKVWSIGRTAENRSILALRLDFPGTKKRSTIIVEGGIHAREWISPAFVTYLIFSLIHSPDSKDANLKYIANNYLWYFVPVLNPDGYEYTHIKDRLWRKNRNGLGVDINRNFDAAFGTTGVSKDPNSDTYCGKNAFSEKESAAMLELVRSECENLKFYLAFHSYGQYMIMPYAYTKQHLDNFEDVRNMCIIAGEEIKKEYGTQYTVGTAFDTVGYTTAGVSGCWAKKNCSIPYVVTFELRDSGSYGFALPALQILPTCEETMIGVIKLITQTKHKKFTEIKFLSGRNTKNILDISVLFVMICCCTLYIFD